MLFEPVAVECFADWLAVADRETAGSSSTCCGRRDFFSVEVPLVQDPLWSPSAALLLRGQETSSA